MEWTFAALEHNVILNESSTDFKNVDSPTFHVVVARPYDEISVSKILALIATHRDVKRFFIEACIVDKESKRPDKGLTLTISLEEEDETTKNDAERMRRERTKFNLVASSSASDDDDDDDEIFAISEALYKKLPTTSKKIKYVKELDGKTKITCVFDCRRINALDLIEIDSLFRTSYPETYVDSVIVNASGGLSKYDRDSDDEDEDNDEPESASVVKSTMTSHAVKRKTKNDADLHLVRMNVILLNRSSSSSNKRRRIR